MAARGFGSSTTRARDSLRIRCMAFTYVRRLRGLSLRSLAVPFLDDEGGGEDDYALLPPPKPIGVLRLTGLVFFAVSGSAYGIEETVSSGGPLLALSGLVLAALAWSAPLAMVACELSVALPHSGGYIIWVNTAFGPLASLLNGMANLLCNVFDCALYPLLLTDYLQRFILPLLPPEPQGGGSSWLRLAPDFLGTALRLLLVALAVVTNILGANVVGTAAGTLMLVVSLPFAWLTVAAYASPTSHAFEPFDPALQNWPGGHSQLYFLAALVLWNTCGYDSAGMIAAEVVDGPRTIPRALTAALLLTTGCYLLPLAACASADPNWRSWREGQFELLGEAFGGRALGTTLLLSSIVSMVGVMCTPPPSLERPPDLHPQSTRTPRPLSMIVADRPPPGVCDRARGCGWLSHGLCGRYAHDDVLTCNLCHVPAADAASEPRKAPSPRWHAPPGGAGKRCDDLCGDDLPPLGGSPRTLHVLLRNQRPRTSRPHTRTRARSAHTHAAHARACTPPLPPPSSLPRPSLLFHLIPGARAPPRLSLR